MKRWLRPSQLARTKRVQGSGAGYTITEVIIVFAVTTVMFTAIAILFSGRQARVEFTQAVRNYELELQNLIDEVANGIYESERDCQAGGASAPTFPGSPLPVSSGTKEPCIFLGKLLVRNSPTEDTIVTVVGRRLTSGANPQPVSTLAEARPRVDASADRVINHTYQLEVTRTVQLPLMTDVAIIGYLNQLSGTSGSGSNLVQLYGANNSNLNDLAPLADGALICVRGQNGQRAEITLGGNDTSTTTIASVLDTSGGVCP